MDQRTEWASPNIHPTKDNTPQRTWETLGYKYTQGEIGKQDTPGNNQELINKKNNKKIQNLSTQDKGNTRQESWQIHLSTVHSQFITLRGNRMYCQALYYSIRHNIYYRLWLI